MPRPHANSWWSDNSQSLCNVHVLRNASFYVVFSTIYFPLNPTHYFLSSTSVLGHNCIQTGICKWVFLFAPGIGICASFILWDSSLAMSEQHIPIKNYSEVIWKNVLNIRIHTVHLQRKELTIVRAKVKGKEDQVRLTQLIIYFNSK